MLEVRDVGDDLADTGQGLMDEVEIVAFVGQTVDFTIKVVPHAGSGQPTGTVQLREGGSPLGAAKALSSGLAVIHVSDLGPGTLSPTGRSRLIGCRLIFSTRLVSS